MNLENTTSQGQGDVSDDLNLQDIVGLLMSGKWIILAVALIFNILGISYAFLAAPVYTANGLVQVEQDQKGLATATHDIESLLLGESTETEAEMQILQSRLVLLKVIGKLNLEISAAPKMFPIFGGAVYRAREDLDKPAGAFLGLRSFAWGGEKIEVSSLDVSQSLLNKEFQLKAEKGGYTLYDNDGDKVLSGVLGTEAAGTIKKDDLHGDVRILVTELVAQPGTKFVVTKRSLEDVLKDFDKRFKVEEEGKKSGVIGLKITGGSPKFVASVMQEIEDAYVHQNIERRSEEAGQSLSYLEDQLPLIKAKVDTAQGLLSKYQTKHGSVDIDKETGLILQQSIDLESQRVTLSLQREQALQHFTANNPNVEAIAAQIGEIERQQLVLKSRTGTLPQTQQDIVELNRDVTVNSDLYTSLLTIIQQLQVAKAGTVGDVRVVDYPLKPIKPSSPKKALVAIASLVLGLLLGSGFVYLRKTFIRGVENPEVLERALGLPTYATIPFVPAQRAIEKAIEQKTTTHNILAVLDSKNIAIEALRSLRSSLHFAMLEAGNNVVMFTGPSPGLGKSFVSINLGVVLAASGKRTVVVDADLRRGHLHKYIGVEASPGISNYVAGEADLESVIRATPVPGLSFVSSGRTPPNPSELLLHERFAELIKALESRFDHVLIDTAPVLPVADAMIVGRVAGCVLVVLKAGEHPLPMIEETMRRLNRAGVQVKGVIFNQVGQRVGSYGYGGYGYYYSSEYKSADNA